MLLRNEISHAVPIGVEIELLVDVIVGLTHFVVEGIGPCVCLLTHLVVVYGWEVDLSITTAG